MSSSQQLNPSSTATTAATPSRQQPRLYFVCKLPAEVTDNNGQVITGAQNIHRYLMHKRASEVKGFIQHHANNAQRTPANITKTQKLRSLFENITVINDATTTQRNTIAPLNGLAETQAQVLYSQLYLCHHLSSTQPTNPSVFHDGTERALGSKLENLIIQIEHLVGRFTRDEYHFIYTEPKIHQALLNTLKVAIKLYHPSQSSSAVAADANARITGRGIHSQNFAACLEMKAEAIRRELLRRWILMAEQMNEMVTRGRCPTLP